MRTVTFSNEAVAAAVNERFVSTWVNRKPGFHNCDQHAERKIAERECFATKNFCTFFVLPDETVLHYFSGYFAPSMYLDEVKFVLDLAEQAVDAKGKVKWDRYGELHRARAERLEAQAKELEPGEKTPHQPKAWAPEHFKHQGLTYVARVHRSLTEKTPTKLKDVWSDYLFGNSFTEE